MQFNVLYNYYIISKIDSSIKIHFLKILINCQ